VLSKNLPGAESRLRAGAIRIGLNGEPAGVITPEQASGGVA
jgi:hypothetical protein